MHSRKKDMWKSRHRLEWCTSKEALKIAGNHQKLGEHHGIDFPSELPEWTNFAGILISDFYPPALSEKEFLLKSPIVY